MQPAADLLAHVTTLLLRPAGVAIEKVMRLRAGLQYDYGGFIG
jgi:hypothetical protein